MGSRGVDVPLSARRSAERAVQRVRQAEVVEWYRRLHKAIAEAERVWRCARIGRPRRDDLNDYLAARNAARAIPGCAGVVALDPVRRDAREGMVTMTGHRPWSELKRTFTPERRRRIAEQVKRDTQRGIDAPPFERPSAGAADG